jgi:hypothetical protein
MVTKRDQRNLRRRITITNNNFGPGNHINNNDIPAEPISFSNTGNDDIQRLANTNFIYSIIFFKN